MAGQMSVNLRNSCRNAKIDLSFFYLYPQKAFFTPKNARTGDFFIGMCLKNIGIPCNFISINHAIQQKNKKLQMPVLSPRRF